MANLDPALLLMALHARPTRAASRAVLLIIVVSLAARGHVHLAIQGLKLSHIVYKDTTMST